MKCEVYVFYGKIMIGWCWSELRRRLVTNSSHRLYSRFVILCPFANTFRLVATFYDAQITSIWDDDVCSFHSITSSHFITASHPKREKREKKGLEMLHAKRFCRKKSESHNFSINSCWCQRAFAVVRTLNLHYPICCHCTEIKGLSWFQFYTEQLTAQILMSNELEPSRVEGGGDTTTSEDAKHCLNKKLIPWNERTRFPPKEDYSESNPDFAILFCRIFFTSRARGAIIKASERAAWWNVKALTFFVLFISRRLRECRTEEWEKGANNEKFYYSLQC